jgi:hypothetical protein
MLVGERDLMVNAPTPVTSIETIPPAEPPLPASPSVHRNQREAQPEAAAPGNGASRRARYGLSLRFERRADDSELARLVENTIWVNEAHPAFARAESSRALAYHIALSTALALAPLAAAPTEEHRFVTQFLAEWGAVHRVRRRPHRRTRRRANRHG